MANLTGPQVQPNPNPSIFDTAEFSAFVDRNKTRNTTKTMYFSVLTSLFLVNITSLGIYRGDANMTGNILLNLSDPVRFESLNQNRAFRSLIHVNSSIIDNVLDFPSLYYVQLLSKTFPKGESVCYLFPCYFYIFFGKTTIQSLHSNYCRCSEVTTSFASSKNGPITPKNLQTTTFTEYECSPSDSNLSGPETNYHVFETVCIISFLYPLRESSVLIHCTLDKLFIKFSIRR